MTKRLKFSLKTTMANLTLILYTSSNKQLIYILVQYCQCWPFLLKLVNENGSKQRSQQNSCISEQHSGVLLLDYLMFLNESFESLIQWSIHKAMFHSWMNQLSELIFWTNASMTHSLRQSLAAIYWRFTFIFKIGYLRIFFQHSIIVYLKNNNNKLYIYFAV